MAAQEHIAHTEDTPLTKYRFWNHMAGLSKPQGTRSTVYLFMCMTISPSA